MPSAVFSCCCCRCRCSLMPHYPALYSPSPFPSLVLCFLFASCFLYKSSPFISRRCRCHQSSAVEHWSFGAAVAVISKHSANTFTHTSCPLALYKVTSGVCQFFVVFIHFYSRRCCRCQKQLFIVSHSAAAAAAQSSYFTSPRASCVCPFSVVDWTQLARNHTH